MAAGENVVLVGLMPARAGTITLADEEITGLSSGKNLHIGGQFVDRATLRTRMDKQNVAFLHLADRVFTLENGRMKFEGSVEALPNDDALHRAYFGLG